MNKGKIWVGTSGWVYKSWKLRFYPEKLSEKNFLGFYAERFPTTEINNSFYRLPSTETYQKWAQAVGEDFIFAVKASKYLTHMKKLKDPEEPWSRITNSVAPLGEHLGPILLQFPENWQKNTDRLIAFLELAAASEIKYRLAFEFRHATWFEQDVLKILEKYNAALCLADSSHFVRKDAITADFAYLRYHGRRELYASSYTKAELKEEAERIEQYLSQGLDVYAYFNNDVHSYATKNALTLTEMLSIYA